MNKRLVYVPISYKDGFNMSANIVGDNQKGLELYLKNALVALTSVGKYNDVDLAIVVNFELSTFFANLFKENNIAIYKIEFDDYKMPMDFVWSLAFFKITALKYITTRTEYEYTLQLESDEICISNFDDMWQELDTKILMFYSPFRVNHPTRILYSKLMHEIYDINNDIVINKTGAGFIAGQKGKLLDFVKVCDEVYSYLKAKDFSVAKNIGDELYTSIYCALRPESVNNANAYAAVYWTGCFYYVSTNYKYDPVSIIHLPDEKKYGLIKVFNYLLKKKKLPKNEKIFKMMHFPKRPIRFAIRERVFGLKAKILGKGKK